MLSLGATASAQVPLPEMGDPAGVHLLEQTAGPGLVSLTVDAAAAGSEPTVATNASTQIYWANGIGETAKLTVETVCPGQSFSLSVEIAITSWSSGTQASVEPAVALTDGMLATDLLRDLGTTTPANTGTATLTYRASATVADGTSADVGDDHHTVTYTLIEQ